MGTSTRLTFKGWSAFVLDSPAFGHLGAQHMVERTKFHWFYTIDGPEDSMCPADCPTVPHPAHVLIGQLLPFLDPKIPSQQNQGRSVLQRIVCCGCAYQRLSCWADHVLPLFLWSWLEEEVTLLISVPSSNRATHSRMMWFRNTKPLSWAGRSEHLHVQVLCKALIVEGACHRLPYRWAKEGSANAAAAQYDSDSCA